MRLSSSMVIVAVLCGCSPPETTPVANTERALKFAPPIVHVTGRRVDAPEEPPPDSQPRHVWRHRQPVEAESYDPIVQPDPQLAPKRHRLPPKIVAPPTKVMEEDLPPDIDDVKPPDVEK